MDKFSLNTDSFKPAIKEEPREKIKSEKNVFFNGMTIIQIVLIIIIFLVIAVISSGFEYSIEKLLDNNYRILILSKMIATLIFYNMTFGIDQRNRRRPADTKYYRTIKTNKLRIDTIYRDNRFEDLDNAIKEENEETYKTVCNKLLHDITRRISYKDIDIENLDIEEKLKKIMLCDKQKEELRQLVIAIINGKVRYEEINEEDILVDKDNDGDASQSMKFDFKKFLIRQNVIKAFMFLGITILITIITPTDNMTNFFQELLNNLLLLIGAIASAVLLSYNYVKRKIRVFEKRNNFLYRRMGININYNPIDEKEEI